MIPFFSRMFPGTNLQDLNLDWIVRRIMELSKGIIAPFINQDNKHWMTYDTATETFVDSGVSAEGQPGPEGPQGPAGPPTDSAIMAIVIDGDTAAQSAAAGQYVIVRNSTITGKPAGLYKAALAIPANTAITASYLTALVATGGFNDLVRYVTKTVYTATNDMEGVTGAATATQIGYAFFFQFSLAVPAIAYGSTDRVAHFENFPTLQSEILVMIPNSGGTRSFLRISRTGDVFISPYESGSSFSGWLRTTCVGVANTF